MGVEDSSSAFSRLSELIDSLGDPMPSKNTFIHYDESDDDVPVPPPMMPLIRAHTEPHGRMPSEADRCFVQSAMQVETLTERDTHEDGSTTEHSGEDHLEASSDQHEVEVASHEHDLWVIDGKKLRGKDTRQSHTFTICLGDGQTEEESLDFVVLVRSKTMSRRRGQGCFAASNGVGSVEVKCTKDLAYPVAISVVVGNGGQPCPGMPPFWHVHDFSQEPIFKVEHEFNFLDLLDKSKDTLTIGLCIESRAPVNWGYDDQPWMPLAEAPGFQEMEPAAFGMWTVDNNGAWTMEGLAVPMMAVFAPCAWVQMPAAPVGYDDHAEAPQSSAGSTSAQRELSPGREFD